MRKRDCAEEIESVGRYVEGRPYPILSITQLVKKPRLVPSMAPLH